ncbi:MAG TPA: ABC transporter substrate-binding protein [Candidatus Aphodovivens avistercoris]|nr:ABC transporter substrate-binding protein [Candidatus Aphodovivens avistercoris]
MPTTSSPVLTRRSLAKLALAGGGALALGGMLSGCSQPADGGDGAGTENDPGNASDDAQARVIVTMPTGAEPAAGFDPFVSWGCGEHVHEPLIQSTLIVTNADMGFENDLATDYFASDDGLVWTFTIREDAVFSDGEPLTAADVAFTVNGIIASPAAEADLSMVDEAVATGDYTVELHLNRPFNILLYTLANVGICPEHAHGADYSEHPIGSGRYVLTQWDKGQQVIFDANPLYYGEAPLIDRVVVLFMDEDASLAAAQSGSVDLAYTSATFADAAVDGYDLLNCRTVDSRGISLPTLPSGFTWENGDTSYEAGNDVTSDAALRRAMNVAIDRDLAIEHTLGGFGTPAYSVSDGMPWASDDMKVATDVDRARRILADGGWAAGADGVLEKGGVRASFDLLYMTPDTVRQALAADFAEQMAALGIEVNVRGVSWDDLEPQSYSQAILWGWGSNSPVEIYELNHSNGWGNYACRANATTDAYLDEAVGQTHVEDSYDYYRLAQWDGTTGVTPESDAPWVWIANVDHLYFVRAGLEVAEQKPHPHGHGWSIVNNVDRWSW